MTQRQDLVPIVDMLIEGDTEAAESHLLAENQEQQIIRAMGGDRMPMNYLLKFEEYLDDHDIYLYDNWEKAQVLGRPRVQRFWVIVYLWVPKETDLRGMERIKTDQEGQNQIRVKKLKDGSRILEVKVLRRLLDKVEKKSQEEADEVSNEKIGQSPDA